MLMHNKSDLECLFVWINQLGSKAKINISRVIKKATSYKKVYVRIHIVELIDLTIPIAKKSGNSSQSLLS